MTVTLRHLSVLDTTSIEVTDDYSGNTALNIGCTYIYAMPVFDGYECKGRVKNSTDDIIMCVNCSSEVYIASTVVCITSGLMC